ncbi:MAG: lytic murein transglycosylase [Hyphomicrobiales bacterium]
MTAATSRTAVTTALLLALGLVLSLGSTPALADAAFDRWVAGFWPTAKAAGVSHATYKRAFAGVTPDPEVLEKASKQAEFVKPLWEYLDTAVSDTRLTNGRRLMAENAATLDAVERRYGVDKYIVAAIWGMESSYGMILDNPKIMRSVIRSLATLAYAGGRRTKFGRQQLVAALKILERGDTTPDRMTGSWAGAMGHTQFIPTTFEAYAVDFDGDGRRNIWSSVGDALGSTAHYLHRSGWDNGKTWGYEVKLPRGFNFRLADERTRRSLADWQKLGIERIGARDFPRPTDQAVLYLPAGGRGPAFLLLGNFRVIKRYNNANAYALAVGHLADRLRGGGAFAAGWPRDDRPLSRAETVELQQRLMARGLDTGGADGMVGPKTEAAIIAYQNHLGLLGDGFPSLMLLQKAREGK